GPLGSRKRYFLESTYRENKPGKFDGRCECRRKRGADTFGRCCEGVSCSVERSRSAYSRVGREDDGPFRSGFGCAVCSQLRESISSPGRLTRGAGKETFSRQERCR